ncbi:hypothetical protein AX16_010740 [Volvariella volvacea WC 439]|nr:hypothetical protein AX16_010740 [Volvariella volvacea WC 439]
MGALPTELIEQIIGFIGDTKDIPTLNSCALASRNFLSISRYHKYSSVSITCYEDLSILQRFATLLEDCPAVANYVQSFSLSEKDNRIDSEEPSRLFRNPWAYVDKENRSGIGKDLPTVLGSFTNLRSLHLQTLSYRNYPKFSDPMKQALKSALRLPTFHTLSLDGFRDIAGTLFSETPIKALYMTHCSIAFNDSPATEANLESYTPELTRFRAQTVYLEDLRLQQTYLSRYWEQLLDFFLHPSCPFNLTSLKRFDVQLLDGREGHKVMKVVDKCKHLLQSFHYGISEYSQSGVLDSLSLSSLVNLKHLTIRTRVSTPEDLNRLSLEDILFPGPIIAITSILLTLPGLSHLSLSTPSPSASQQAPTCSLESISIGFISSLRSARISQIHADTSPEVARNINIQLQAWERLDDLLTAFVTSKLSAASTGNDTNVDFLTSSARAVQPVVRIHCLGNISIKNLKRKSLKRCFGTGRMEVIIAKSQDETPLVPGIGWGFIVI